MDKGTQNQSAAEYKETEIYNKALTSFSDGIEKIGESIKIPLEKLETGNYSEEELVTIFAYLKVRKQYFRSGYFKERICRRLKKCCLNEDQKETLRIIIIEQINYARREFSAIMHLIPWVSSNDFEEKLKKHGETGNLFIKGRVDRIISTYFKDRR
ncbi:MAG: hypothetical protein KKD05_00955 [Candidatus Omnitrophica bacterium]|nr:hypothetical protein [Candidatus Omnitrophota bacterium]